MLARIASVKKRGDSPRALNKIESRMATFSAKRTTRTVKIRRSLSRDERRLYFSTRHAAPVLAHSYECVGLSLYACLSLSLSLFSALRPFSSPFLVSSSLRHRYALCDPIVPSCPTAAQVRDTTRHARARAIAARIARATLWSVKILAMDTLH